MANTLFLYVSGAKAREPFCLFSDRQRLSQLSLRKQERQIALSAEIEKERNKGELSLTFALRQRKRHYIFLSRAVEKVVVPPSLRENQSSCSRSKHLSLSLSFCGESESASSVPLLKRQRERALPLCRAMEPLLSTSEAQRKRERKKKTERKSALSRSRWRKRERERDRERKQ